MKRYFSISAKLKLTIWSCLLMILMASIVTALMFSFSGNIIANNIKTTLTQVLDDNADELEFEDGRLEIEDIDFFKKSVYTLIYSQDKERIAGNLPDEFNSEPQLKDKVIADIIIDGTTYYTYDRLVFPEDYPKPFWLRGVIAVDEVTSATNSILQTALFSLPIFILLASLGCYFIAKHTFSPIDKIILTAEQIENSENLSLRINLQNSDPEIQKLSNTFDKMFERLENAFEAEKQFSQNVSHELRTPIAVILAQCEYSLDRSANDKDRQEALNIIQKQAKKTSNLISELLTLIRLERGLESLEFMQIDLSELITIVCEEQTIIAPQTIDFNYEITPNIMLRANQSMLIRLITNLLNNAFRYNKENGKVNVSLREDNQIIILEVKDNGIGLTPDQKTKIWQRFYQVDPARSADNSQNMGLGLAMVKQIAKVHKAKISVISELGQGSCFRVEFFK